jgi:hypothetical protein
VKRTFAQAESLDAWGQLQLFQRPVYEGQAIRGRITQKVKGAEQVSGALRAVLRVANVDDLVRFLEDRERLERLDVDAVGDHIGRGAAKPAPPYTPTL